MKKRTTRKYSLCCALILDQRKDSAIPCILKLFPQFLVPHLNLFRVAPLLREAELERQVLAHLVRQPHELELGERKLHSADLEAGGKGGVVKSKE